MTTQYPHYHPSSPIRRLSGQKQLTMETQEKIKQKKNPRETANILSICFFWYSNIFSEEKNPFAVPKFQVDESSSWRRLQKRAGAGGFV